MIKGFPDSHNRQAHAGKPLPKTVGFVVPFNDHEWYTSLIAIIQHESNRLGITLLVKDASATPSAELDQLALMIGTKAAELVRDHEIIILDHEPASLYLAKALRDNPAYKFQNLTVITNSLTILQTLSKVDGCKLVLMGGDYDAAQQALTGRAAALSLQEFQADKAFIGIAGVNEQFGISNTDPVLADTQRAIIQAAKQVIVLSDHTRIGAAARVRVAPLACVHVLVTDIGIAPENRLALTQLGIQVEVAPGETPVSTLK
jgi:DeoR/GlpR family transcriptional regulator of sugar metabolism